ncbi:hypothetical protein [Verrucosispora sp. WMMC514]|uniref:hypothetical protein n=1 Tax=Verrucosispora sp. WMMC514 TaxID=3015156 RepID=UPI00248C79D6|nr:hypothetical protein [Verrucosispora sp. WMMC514]WBB94169.1 hypothetical protein O7597_15070 [Verrucosispora sp. WMMC514]
MTQEQAPTRAERVRDITMALVLVVWTVYAAAAVIQLFRSGAQVLESLPPFWFWGIPLAPYSALYTPWTRPGGPPPPPAAPTPPPSPEPAQ